MFKISDKILNPSPEDLHQLKDQFSKKKYIKLQEFFTEPTLKLIHERVSNANFQEHQHKDLGESYEDKFLDLNFYYALELIINSEPVYRFIEQMSDFKPISCFKGRIYKFSSDEKHRCIWHSDTVQARQVAMSINLSPKHYEGGNLQIRYRDTHDSLVEVENKDIGSVILFKIDESLEHRVQNVTGEEPKIALAGWFKSEPKSYFDFLNNSDSTNAIK